MENATGKIQRFLQATVVREERLQILHGMEIHGIGPVVGTILMEQINHVALLVCQPLVSVDLQMDTLSFQRQNHQASVEVQVYL